jgi:hypothetical protein
LKIQKWVSLPYTDTKAKQNCLKKLECFSVDDLKQYSTSFWPVRFGQSELVLPVSAQGTQKPSFEIGASFGETIWFA